jgi:transposase
MREATTTRKVDYFRLPRPLWRKLKKYLPKRTNKSNKRGGRPRVSDRAVANAIWYVLWTGCQWKAIHREWFGVSASVVHERFQRWRRAGIFEKLMEWMVEHYAKESAVGSLGSGKRWIPRTLPLLWEGRKRARTPPIGASGARR